MIGNDALDISASGLRAQRIRMEVVANNLANMETTSASRINEGDYTRHIPYKRKNVIFQAGKGNDLGVLVPQIIEDSSDFRKEFNPQHRHAVSQKSANIEERGYVYFPNINPIVEMVDMLNASRAYEANATAIETLKAMGSTSLRILA